MLNKNRFILIVIAFIFQVGTLAYAADTAEKLFPENLPANKWVEFSAAGFSKPVNGVIFQKDSKSLCGVPLGGLGTGCLDVETRGVLGFESIFFPRRNMKPFISYDVLRNPQLLLPFLGIAVDDQTWVLATDEFIKGGSILGAIDPVMDGYYLENMDYVGSFTADVPEITSVKSAQNIDYWGHYPVADLQYKTDCPVDVSLRAWSPFVLGDMGASAIPGAVFEVHLENTTQTNQKASLAFSFPGPTVDEAGTKYFTRSSVNQTFKGLHVVSQNAIVSYFLGVIGNEPIRYGDALSTSPDAWSKISKTLPTAPVMDFEGKTVSTSAGTSAAVDVNLAPNEKKTIRFLLTWYCTQYEGGSYDEVVNAFERPNEWGVSPYEAPGRENMMGVMYSPMYTTRYSNAVEVAKKLTNDHEKLLRKTLAWQQAIYESKELPGWLRDCLVNHLYVIAESSLWAAPKKPLGDWTFPNGAFAMTECPGICSITGCTASDWYGDFPLMYFFPDLQRMLLRLYKEYQRPDGAIPFLWASRDVTKPTYDWQIGLNGPCFTGLVHRFWLITGDDSVLTEFYPAIKKNVYFTMGLNPSDQGPISVHRKGPGQSWWEHTPIYGMVSHIGGVRLAYLKMVKNMAEKLGDKEFATECQAWFDKGSKALEENLWCEDTKSYMLFNDPETDRKSKTILSAQLDGDWACFINGLDPVFRRDRAETALKTIKKTCLTDYGMLGMMDYDTEDGVPTPHPYGTFTAEIRMIGMTYMYNGQEKFGLDVIKRLMNNMVLKQGMAWDLYCLIRTDTGGPRTGSDYFQNMMLWSVPAAMAGGDIGTPARPGGLAHRVLQAVENTE